MWRNTKKFTSQRIYIKYYFIKPKHYNTKFCHSLRSISNALHLKSLDTPQHPQGWWPCQLSLSRPYPFLGGLHTIAILAFSLIFKDSLLIRYFSNHLDLLLCFTFKDVPRYCKSSMGVKLWILRKSKAYNSLTTFQIIYEH